jgi:MFS family permease
LTDNRSGAFSGLLAFAIGQADGVLGHRGWRWILVVEGVLSILVAIAAYFWIQETPANAKILSEEERRFIILRYRYSYGSSQSGSKDEFTWSDFFSAVKVSSYSMSRISADYPELALLGTWFRRLCILRRHLRFHPYFTYHCGEYGLFIWCCSGIISTTLHLRRPLSSSLWLLLRQVQGEGIISHHPFQCGFHVSYLNSPSDK